MERFQPYLSYIGIGLASILGLLIVVWIVVAVNILLKTKGLPQAIAQFFTLIVDGNITLATETLYVEDDFVDESRIESKNNIIIDKERGRVMMNKINRTFGGTEPADSDSQERPTVTPLGAGILRAVPADPAARQRTPIELDLRRRGRMSALAREGIDTIGARYGARRRRLLDICR